MFTGLVEEMGTCEGLVAIGSSARLTLAAPGIAPHVRTGESVAVNGCCLTATTLTESTIAFDLLEETLRRTNLKALKQGSKVNLERALSAAGRLGGHFVQGHVDTPTTVLAVTASGSDLRLDFRMPPDFARYIAFKGSVAINGTSLTVAEVGPDSFAIWIIPHTREVTNLGLLQPGDDVNLECDILAKYTERILADRTADPGSSVQSGLN